MQLLLDTYLDAVPRTGAAAEPRGPFTVFIGRGPWGYYARPGSHRGLGHRFTTGEVTDVCRALRDRGLAEAIEWVHDTDPSLAEACSAAGLEVVFRPLLVLDTAGFEARPDESAEIVTRVLGADDPLLPVHRNVADVAFTNGGTGIGPAGAAERDAVPADEVAAAWIAERVRAGHTIAVAALDAAGDMVGVGSAQPMIDAVRGLRAAELTGIAVLPTHRRRGIAAAITAALVTACAERGVELALLSAQDDAVARVYERVGFRRAATFAEAAPQRD